METIESTLGQEEDLQKGKETDGAALQPEQEINEKVPQKPDELSRLTEIRKKAMKRESLTKDDLIFVYGMRRSGDKGNSLKGDIRSIRNPKEDISIIFDCQPSQIAVKEEEISKETRAYIGPIFPGLFSKDIERVYISTENWSICTNFPEGKIEKGEMTIGGTIKVELKEELNKKSKLEDPTKKFFEPPFSAYAESMFDNPEFTVTEKAEQINLVKLKVEDLGFPDGATPEEIKKRAEKLGLELCPSEVGPRLFLNYKQAFKREQSEGEWLNIHMKPLIGRDGDLRVFSVERDDIGRQCLDSDSANPDYPQKWKAKDEVCFSFKK